MARMVERESQDAQEAMEKPHLDAYTEKRPAEESPAYRERVYELVRRIPLGRVMTYGQIADILGPGYTARTIGFVMHGAMERDTPWQRVINSQGGCSTTRFLLPPDKQQKMLEAEGVKFDDKGRCNLKKYRWSPPEVADDEQPKLF
jgi:methylated-DNA-protein-cysteine methyltransferase-like protein